MGAYILAIVVGGGSTRGYDLMEQAYNHTPRSFWDAENIWGSELGGKLTWRFRWFRWNYIILCCVLMDKRGRLHSVWAFSMMVHMDLVCEIQSRRDFKVRGNLFIDVIYHVTLVIRSGSKFQHLVIERIWNFCLLTVNYQLCDNLIYKIDCILKIAKESFHIDAISRGFVVFFLFELLDVFTKVFMSPQQIKNFSQNSHRKPFRNSS